MAEAEKNCHWHFAAQLGGREDGPNEPMTENFKKYPYASLVRESIQNSLDVQANPNEPVRVEYSLNRIRGKDFPNFFDLGRHIRGCLMHFPSNSDAINAYQPMKEYIDGIQSHEKLWYIDVADYNTKGMEYIENDTSNPFYAFVRAAGVSAKQDSASGGSYGYGKAAYFYLSKLRTVFVSTKTLEGDVFFEGVSSLCTHELPGEKGLYVSVGYYDNQNGNPITSTEKIPTRFQREEPGTTISIIGFDASDKEYIYKEMTIATLRNFWMAIESGNLEVKIGDTLINKDSIPQLMEVFFTDNVDNYKTDNQYNPRPYWEAVHYYVEGDNKHKKIEADLEILGHVKFYALKNKDATDKVIYMRKPLMRVFRKKTQSSFGFYGVFVCSDQHGNEYLRKMENPAHNEWVPQNWKENGRTVTKAKDCKTEIERFIIEALKEIFSNRSSNTQQIKGLEEFLYIPTAVEEDEEFESQAMIGDLVKSDTEAGNMLSTNLVDPVSTPQSKQSEPLGKVIVDDPEHSKKKKDPKGKSLGGHGKNPKNNKGGGGPASKQVEGHYGGDDNGKEGTFLQEIPVRYRVFAQPNGNEIEHILVIHSDFDVEKARIDLLVGGEQSDETVTIKECSVPALIEKNSISGLSLKDGVNYITIKFADRMRHSVKLDAYEYK